MAIKTLKNIKILQNKNVLIRVDFDVPITKTGQVENTTRIEKCLPTIRYLLERNAKVILLTKLGRPQEDKRISTKILIPLLEKFLNKKIIWLSDPLNSEIPNLLNKPNNLFLLENIRFYKEEENRDENFAKALAKPYDLYVNEAFAMCHRNDASVSLIPKFLPSYAGLRLMEEYNTLTNLIKNPKRPFIAIIGGAKVETKLSTIENLAIISDKVLIGGKLSLELNPNLLKSPKIINSKDWIDNKDIGPKTIALFKEELSKAKTIVWNGPMGMFEDEKYAKGTKEIAQFISNLNTFKVIGGGDTISAITKAGVLDKMDFVSMGGGAMLVLLSGKNLPGISALKENDL
ncbi:MAG: phosphoglycerate kinase [bacterium]